MTVAYHLFLDESGDHGLVQVNSEFPVFVLCGILMSDVAWGVMNDHMIAMKKRFWGNRKAILHSRDIRKCEKEFVILFDPEIKRTFYQAINDIVAQSEYAIIAAAINKDAHIKKYGKLADDVYQIALSFVVERAIFYLDDQAGQDKRLHITIERRGGKEDTKLREHFQQICSRGTAYVSRERLQRYGLSMEFRAKKDDINGLQLADLIAYPVARHVMDPDRANPAFDVLAEKFYAKGGKRYGLKVFP